MEKLGRLARRGSEGVLPKQAGEAVLAAVDKAVTVRWDQATKRAAAANGATLDERVNKAVRAFEAELLVGGAAVGGAAAAPGVGTVSAVALSIAELGWITVRLSDLILTVAVLHGHGRASVEERRAWTLSILAFGDGAAAGFTKFAGEFGKGLGGKAVGRIPSSALSQINRALGRTIITKYGTKRGAIALGRVLPFGIGAVVGALANYVTVHASAGKPTDSLGTCHIRMSIGGLDRCR